MKQNQDIIPLIEMVGRESQQHQLCIIGNISGQALETCILTNLKSPNMKVLVVPPPVYGDMIVPFMEDLAILTGGKLIPSNMPPDKVDGSYIGLAEKVVSNVKETTIYGGGGASEDVSMRIDNIREQLKDPKYNAFQRERLELRLSKLQGKIGLIRVGGATEQETKEIRFRVDDAVNATRSAKEGGIVAGGATTLARIKLDLDLSRDEQAGVDLVIESLAEPFKQLMENAGENGGYRLQQILKSDMGYGFDVKNMTEEPIDLIKAGIIDPTMVLMSVVENACSSAGVSITSKMAVTLDQETKKEAN